MMLANKRLTWHKRWLKLAFEVASWSKDPSTQCGCVIVSPENAILSLGYNGFPRGVEYTQPERLERPEKYFWMEHAERNALYNALRSGIILPGGTAYITNPPCHDCARGLIQSGIEHVVVPIEVNLDVNYTSSVKWHDSVLRAKEMFRLTSVRYQEVDINE